MSLKWIVLKFGGTSVSSLSNWQTIADICEKKCRAGYHVLVVCSAKSGVSNKLEKIVSLATENQHHSLLDEIENEHREFCRLLEIPAADVLLKQEFDELKRLLLGLSLLGSCEAKVVAKILALGELMLTKVAYEWLSLKMTLAWIDARHLIRVENVSCANPNESRGYLSASCLADSARHIQDYLVKKKANLFITQGFIASNSSNETVLLGRGGSDITATYLGAALSAVCVEIWTDVPGLFTANPHCLASARLLKHLNYEEAEELASSGAKVLHPKCIDFVRKKKIPLVICWTHRPTQIGTTINHVSGENSAQVKAVVTKTNVYMISMESMGMWQEVGFLANIFSCFKKHEISLDLIATSQSTVTVTLDSISTILDDVVLDALMEDLSKICRPTKIGPCSVVSLVGRHIRSILPVIGPMLEAFRKKSIYLISQSASDLNFSFVVAQEELGKIVERLHQFCFSNLHICSWLGPSWQELFIQKKYTAMTLPVAKKWWLEKIDQLVTLGKQSSPRYVYDKETAGNAAKNLQGVRGISRVNYAVKANYYPGLLTLFYDQGLSFDCVSWAEVHYLKTLFPELDPSRVVFTPNFAPLNEYILAVEYGCFVTLDNLYLLIHHPQVFQGKSILIRVDPGVGKGHHRFVETAGNASKFGITTRDLVVVSKLAKQYDIKIIGLHAHVGSGIFEVNTWLKLAYFLLHVAKDFPDVRILDIGGGFGVPEKIEQSPLDLKRFSEAFSQFSGLMSYEIWLEPGRFLVAEAGVLLTAVTQKKEKNDKNFVGVDTGMNSFIRHSLYGSFHEVINISQMKASDYMHTDIVGPICESGDVFGYNRLLPTTTKEGDIILVENTGAYGRSMGSSYNLRAPAEEYFLA